MPFYINSNHTEAPEKITRALHKCIQRHNASWSEMVFLCIGSDRIIGDCLGPFVGQLLDSCTTAGVSVYGTLQKPVHALNLEPVLNYIHQHHPDSLIIAIDASLGQKKHLGYVTIDNGSLYPGAAVQKHLPPVGDIHITGIVNISGEYWHSSLCRQHEFLRSFHWLIPLPSGLLPMPEHSQDLIQTL